MKITVAAAALALAVAPFAANALVVTNLGANPQGAGNGAGLDFAVGFDATLPVGATWDAGVDPLVPSGSVGGLYLSPFSANPLEDADSFLAVGGGAPDAGALGGSAASPRTLSLATPLSAIDILWGSIDNYNSIEFLSGGVSLGVVDGNAAIALTDFAGDVVDPADAPARYNWVGLFSFAAESGQSFDAIRFDSSVAPAFEFAFDSSPAVAQPIPLPLGLGLLGAALVGLGAAARRRAG